MRASQLAVAGMLACVQALRIEPGLPDSEFRDAPYPSNAHSFGASGELVVAASCPCNWSQEAWSVPTDLRDRTLLIPQHLCASMNSTDDAEPRVCTPGMAACTAQRANASAVVFACDFARAEESDHKAPRDCLVQSTESYCGLPAVVVLNNVSVLMAMAAAVNYTIVDPLGATLEMGASSNLSNATLPPAPSLSQQLWVLSTAAIYNVSLTWKEEDGCEVYQNVPIVYLSTVPIWWFLTMVWTWNTYRRNAASARDLHRLLCWVPTLQFINGVLSLFYFSSCPWDGTMELIYAMLWAVVTILKEPVILLCLLLVAKGWCITRNHLHRREICIAGSTVALLYAAISIQLSMSTLISLVPMVIMYIVMLVDIVFSILANLRVLKAQLIVLHSFGIDPTTTPVHRKYIMYVRLAKFTAVYTVLEIVLHSIFPQQANKEYWLFVTLHSLMEIAVATAIGYTFRAQPLNVHFQQVQQVAAELAEQMLPSITTVEVKPEALSGSGLIAWRPDMELNGRRQAGQQLPSTILVLNPGDVEVQDAPPSRQGVRQGAAGESVGSAPWSSGLMSHISNRTREISASRRAGEEEGRNGNAQSASSLENSHQEMSRLPERP